MQLTAITRSHSWKNEMNHKLLRVMKLTAVLLFAACMQVAAHTEGQTVTLKVKNAPMKEVFREIQKQTGLNVMVDEAIVEKVGRVTLDVRDMPVSQVLNICLKNEPLTYTIVNDRIVVKPNPIVLVQPTLNTPPLPPPIDVRGKVVNEKGEPLSGATVTIKGEKNAVVTDINGNFGMSNIKEGSILQISYVGFDRQEIKVSASLLDITIALRLSVNELDEVAVKVSTGYTTVPKSQLTGAVSTISQKTYDQRVAVTGNFLESLEGKLPGLVYQSIPGNSFTHASDLSIRGVSTFDGVKTPLIVLDGFPTEINLNTINPNDIVSVSVLRDAAAASVYGVRASNGVIVIETKRGKAGKPVFSLRTTYATQPKPDFDYLKMAGGDEYLQLQYNVLKWQNFPRALFTTQHYPISPVMGIAMDFNASLINEAEAQRRLALLSYDNQDEYSRLFYRNEQSSQVDFNVSGGGDRNSYILGVNYIKSLPTQRRSLNQRVNVNMANVVQINSRMKFDFKGTYTGGNTQTGGNSPRLGFVNFDNFFPYERLVDDNGNALATIYQPDISSFDGSVDSFNNNLLKSKGMYDQFYYPYKELAANTTTGRNDAIHLQGRLSMKINNWLSMELGGAYENENTQLDVLRTEDAFELRLLLNSRVVRDASTGNALFSNLPKGQIFTRTSGRNRNYTIRSQFNFNYVTPNRRHDLSGIAGAERRKLVAARYTSSLFGYNDRSILGKPTNFATAISTTSRAFPEMTNAFVSFNILSYFSEAFADTRYLSYYGQGTYMYNKKYIATGSIRLDKSNLFGTLPQYRNKAFWSVGLGWRLDQEELIKKMAWVNELKLRASYGFNGNVPTSTNGPFLILNQLINTRPPVALTFNDVRSPENQALRWETTKTYNLGLDYSFFKNKLSGSIDYYNKNSVDLLGLTQSDPTTGFNSYNANTANIVNKGLEIGLNSVNIRGKKFSWRTGLTASFNHNKVIKVVNTFVPNTSILARNGYTLPAAGFPLQRLMSYNYAGLNALGQPEVYDNKGQKVVMSGTVDVTADAMIFSGTITPKYVMGFNNQLSIGKFDLSFLFMYYGGHVMRVQQPDPTDIIGIRPVQGSNTYWRNPGDELITSTPGLPVSGTPGNYQTAARLGYAAAAQYVRKADYIRLRDLIITYHLEPFWLKKAGVTNTQLRLQVQNGWRHTFSGNDIDPDAIDRATGRLRLEVQPLVSFSLYTNF